MNSVVVENKILNYVGLLWIFNVVCAIITAIIGLVRGSYGILIPVVAELLLTYLIKLLIEGVCELIKVQKETKHQVESALHVLQALNEIVPSNENAIARSNLKNDASTGKQEVSEAGEHPEGTWTCPYCHTKNSNYYWTCINCLKTRTDITADEYKAMKN